MFLTHLGGRLPRRKTAPLNELVIAAARNWFVLPLLFTIETRTALTDCVEHPAVSLATSFNRDRHQRINANAGVELPLHRSKHADNQGLNPTAFPRSRDGRASRAAG